MEPVFFSKPSAFRKWLAKNHATKTELVVGFHKVGSGKPSITWPESVDEALCFGWIDGVRRRIDETSYQIRFTPRKPRSIWSAINIAKVAALTKSGRMTDAGLAAFARRDEKRSAIYSFEQRTPAKLPPDDEKNFRANTRAWSFFESRPPWYRRTSIYWVVSAKRPETRVKRLATLIDCCARATTIPLLTRP